MGGGRRVLPHVSKGAHEASGLSSSLGSVPGSSDAKRLVGGDSERVKLLAEKVRRRGVVSCDIRFDSLEESLEGVLGDLSWLDRLPVVLWRSKPTWCQASLSILGAVSVVDESCMCVLGWFERLAEDKRGGVEGIGTCEEIGSLTGVTDGLAGEASNSMALWMDVMMAFVGFAPAGLEPERLGSKARIPAWPSRARSISCRWVSAWSDAVSVFMVACISWICFIALSNCSFGVFETVPLLRGSAEDEEVLAPIGLS